MLHFYFPETHLAAGWNPNGISDSYTNGVS